MNFSLTEFRLFAKINVLARITESGVAGVGAVEAGLDNAIFGSIGVFLKPNLLASDPSRVLTRRKGSIRTVN
jgi:hypothetical protein